MKNCLKQIFTGNYNVLLTFLFLLFLLRPHGAEEPYLSIWKTFLTITLLVAIFNCRHKKKVKIFISALSVPVLGSTWVSLFDQKIETFILSSSLTSLFMLVCLISIIYDVILHPRVNLETLRGLICAYFLIGFLFAYIYFFIELLSPGSILIGNQTWDLERVEISKHSDFFSNMLYFSFTTLLTAGLGDVVPAKPWGTSIYIVEGMFGQFYIAILVARIVSVYSFLSGKKYVKELSKPQKGSK